MLETSEQERFLLSQNVAIAFAFKQIRENPLFQEFYPYTNFIYDVEANKFASCIMNKFGMREYSDIRGAHFV